MIGHSTKSYQYYYYMCSKSHKQGKDACDARMLPKGKLEHSVIEQLKVKVLIQEYMEELVKLVNEELDSAHYVLKDKLDAIDAESRDIGARLSKLYDALETGKLSLDELAPRIRELKKRQNELGKARIQIEADMVAQGVEEVDIDMVKSYTRDLKSLLEESIYKDEQGFGDNVQTWLSNAIIKVGTGAKKIGVSVAAHLITKAIELYLGM